jgi:hypothetical protein
MVAEPRRQVNKKHRATETTRDLEHKPNGLRRREGSGERQKLRCNHYCAHAAREKGTATNGARLDRGAFLILFLLRFAARPEKLIILARPQTRRIKP